MIFWIVIGMELHQHLTRAVVYTVYKSHVVVVMNWTDALVGLELR